MPSGPVPSEPKHYSFNWPPRKSYCISFNQYLCRPIILYYRCAVSSDNILSIRYILTIRPAAKLSLDTKCDLSQIPCSWSLDRLASRSFFKAVGVSWATVLLKTITYQGRIQDFCREKSTSKNLVRVSDNVLTEG
jgi:hypothetical protein